MNNQQTVQGILEIHPKGFGFLRNPTRHYAAQPADPYVPAPRTGKTILLQHIAQAVIQNHPEMHLIMLLIDERPEEVTDMRRTVKGEVVASSSDRDTANHLRIAELVVERGKRLVEQGKQV